MTQDRIYGLRHFKVGCIYQNTGVNSYGYETYAQASFNGVVQVIPQTPLLCVGSAAYHNDGQLHAVFLVETKEQIPAEIALQDHLKVFQFFRQLT